MESNNRNYNKPNIGKHILTAIGAAFFVSVLLVLIVSLVSAVLDIAQAVTAQDSKTTPTQQSKTETEPQTQDLTQNNHNCNHRGCCKMFIKHVVALNTKIPNSQPNNTLFVVADAQQLAAHFQLPNPVAGLTFKFYSDFNGDLQIHAPNGRTIEGHVFGGFLSAQSLTNNSTKGLSMTLVADGSKWLILAYTGQNWSAS